jgi:dipeptidase E
MTARRLLLLSNSKNFGQGYLEHAERPIREFLGKSVAEVLFVPYAAVRVSFDNFTETVRERFDAMGYRLTSVHETPDAVAALNVAQAIAVGGGNTFALLARLVKTGLLQAIRERALAGVPYLGWSAGSNVACPTIRTTNDMPIVEPPSLAAMNLVPFQINPHYTDGRVPQHSGETRPERLLEFIEANPSVHVVGLREGGILEVRDDELRLIGDKPARIFVSGREPFEVAPGESFAFLMT